MNELINRRGRRLTYLSTGIILFEIGGGSVGNSIDLFGGTIEFEYPLVLFGSVVVMLLYFFHTYRLSNEGWINEINSKILLAFRTDQKLINRVTKTLSLDVLSEINGFKESELSNIKVSSNTNTVSIRYNKREKSYFYSARITDVVLRKQENIDIRLSKLFYYLDWYRTFFKEIFPKEIFIQRVLPNILFTFTVTIILLEVTNYFFNIFKALPT